MTQGDNYDNGAKYQLRYIDPELKEFAASAICICISIGIERKHVSGSTFDLTPTVQGTSGYVNSSF